MQKVERVKELTLRMALKCSHCGYPLDFLMLEPDPDDDRDVKQCFEPLSHTAIIPISVDPCKHCCTVDPAKDQHSVETS